MEHFGDGEVVPRERPVGLPDRRRARPVDEHAVQRIQEFITDRPVDGPVRRQELAPAEDLLGHDREAPGERGVRILGEGRSISRADRVEDARPVVAATSGLQTSAARLEEEVLLQPPEIAQGVRQAVGMVDAEAGHAPLADPPEDQRVGRVEDVRVLRPQARQLGHVEEAPVVDLLGRDSPVGEPVDLLLQEPVERIEAGGVPDVPPIGGHVGIEELANPGARGAEAGEPPLDDLLLAPELLDLLRLQLVARRQVPGRVADAEVLRDVVVIRPRTGPGTRPRAVPGRAHTTSDARGSGGRDSGSRSCRRPAPG